VLTYSLTQALRKRGVAHYVLRACPDGEGDWANEVGQHLVRQIRYKGEYTPGWIDYICRDIANRHLPLIVDAGGRPTTWQETVFDQCTHAILLTPTDSARQEWTEMVARHGLPLLADLHSTLTGENQVQTTSPPLSGQISGLERGRTAQGPTFTALVDKVAKLFAYDEGELRQTHLTLPATELVVELKRVKQCLGLNREPGRWLPDDLPLLLDYLPSATPLGLYDRGPNWLYAAVSHHAHPAPFYQFDVRLGWVSPPPLILTPTSTESILKPDLQPQSAYTRLDLTLAESYVDYGEAEGLRLPLVPTERGLVLSGKLPLWLWTALVRTYTTLPWLAVFQPQLGGAVVVASRDKTKPVGQVITLTEHKKPADI
jgi:CRISPR-associated protein Csx3